jgi:hypothetical protein
MPSEKVIKIRREDSQWNWRCPKCFEWTPTTEEIMTTGKEIHCGSCGEGVVLTSPPVTTEDGVQMVVPTFGEA